MYELSSTVVFKLDLIFSKFLKCYKEKLHSITRHSSLEPKLNLLLQKRPNSEYRKPKIIHMKQMYVVYDTTND